MKKVTEQSSPHRHLEKMSVHEVLTIINQEDQSVALKVEKSIPSIALLVAAVLPKMKEGGRLFYIGAGTSGRLGILDASECPPTFGVPDDWVIGLIAGGDQAIRKAVEFAEDSKTQAWQDLQKYQIDDKDTVIGIAASGTTPYVVNALKICQKEGILTGCITCNEDTPMAAFSDHAIEVVVGPETITGSTRMKAGTAQKMVLNMISTSIMIGLGRVIDNKMVDMQLTNTKLVERGIDMIREVIGVEYEEAKKLLEKHGSVRKVILSRND